jgi:stage V sporulation protein R
MNHFATQLTPELAQCAKEIRAHARSFGLDFFEVIFELLDYDQVNMMAAYGGFPTRYPHWRFGMQFEELQKGYVHGLQKIYELVINNDPCYAYLMRCNQLVDQKLVMAHVYGHADFFKHNYWFSHTNRKMMDEFANHGIRIRRYIERHGVDAVESFLDTCLSLENLIDIHSPFIVRQRAAVADEEPIDPSRVQAPRLKSKSYMDSFINPPEVLEAERIRIQAEMESRKRFPASPERDILRFMIEHAPLERWQRDILSIVREEAYYFAPQGMTKIMNEGWASYWHSKMMTERICSAAEIVDYADQHSKTTGSQPGQLNPYKLGLELFRDIEERWNRGQFGAEWEECQSTEARRSWNRPTDLGREKIFEVRSIHNDVTFIDEFLTPDFCERHQLFTYAVDKQSRQDVIESRDFIEVKRRLLDGLTNLGQPVIFVEDANYKNRGELYLAHEESAESLEPQSARDTLAQLARIWGRPVHIETVSERRKKILSFDGSRHEEKIVR